MGALNANKLKPGQLPSWLGDGDGYGDGDGDGDGDGYGDGDGDGYGDGYGYGYGDGDENNNQAYWAASIGYFAERLPAAQRARLAALRKKGAVIAFWRSDKDGRAVNGGVNDPVSPGTVETVPGPLALCGPGALHATLLPRQWNGDRWWIVALIGAVVVNGDKIGALKREIIGECL